MRFWLCVQGCGLEVNLKHIIDRRNNEKGFSWPLVSSGDSESALEPGTSMEYMPWRVAALHAHTWGAPPM